MSGICNKVEAKVVRCLVRELVERGVVEEEVGVIAPSSAQEKFIKVCIVILGEIVFKMNVLLRLIKRSSFPGVEVGTMDQYQWRDKEVILYTCTKSNMGDMGQKGDPRAGHILLDTRRLNVAITRAKVKLVIVGDRQTLLRDYKPFRKRL